MMDIHFYFHRWLLFVSLILVMHQCQDVQGMVEKGRPCPQGQIVHRTQEFQFVSCCFPTRCGVGFEVKPCVNNNTRDTCEPCGAFTNQSRRTSSFTMKKKCVKWHLNEKCESGGDVNPSDPETQRCLCDIEKGFMFDPPEIFYQGVPSEAYCQASNRPCDPGYEPTIKGNCQPCEENHFKAKNGYQLCEPKTDCVLLGVKFLSHHTDPTIDYNCSEPEVFPTPVIKVKTTTSEPVIKEENSITTPPQAGISATTQKEDPLKSGSSQSTDDQGDDDSVIIWPIICLLFVLVIVGAIGFILFLRRRRIPFCCCFTDGEKYGGTHCPTSLPAGDHRHKNGPAGGHFIDPQLTHGEKVMNNNINGGLVGDSPHITSVQRPHVQHNGTFVQFSGPDSSDSEMHFQNQQNSYQANVVPPTARPGILRNGNKPYQGQVAFAQGYATRPQDASMDSIGREKLHVNIDRYQPNQDLGENDPLLITDESAGNGTLSGQGVVFQNRAGVVTNHSPPVQQAAAAVPNQVMFLPPNANFNPLCQNVAGYAHPVNSMNPNMSGSISSGNSSPAVQSGQPTHQVTFAPTLDTVTYKRSLSVIANPEGEAEEELEANVPRFSQLLPDGEDPSLAPSNPILRMAQERDTLALDSPQRDTTHQARTPSERLQTRPPQNPLAPTFVIPAPPEPTARHQLLNYPHPYFTRHPSSTVENVPDHCIMDLKEHQLANSLSSSLANTSGETMLKHAADTQFNLEDFTASSDQTDMKTLGGTIKEEDSSPGAGANSKVHPLGSEGRLRKPSGAASTAQNATEDSRAVVENKKFPYGGNSVDRKRTPSGNSTGVPNVEERHRVPSGDKQKSCLRNLHQEEGDSVGKRPQRLGRGVSFEEDEVKRDNSLGHDTEPKQIRDSFHGPDNQDQNTECNSDEEENRKLRRLAPNGVDTDLSSSESAHGSPSRSNTYRRSQSESSTNTDPTHKPPPRSMSEEKSQKADRPIAKVKPMPASDSSVNQVPAGSGASEEIPTVASSTATEESGDESSSGSSAPDLHSSNPGDAADDEADEQEEERRV